MSLIVFTLLSVVALSNAGLYQGQCPEFQNVADFDLDKYLGRWYEMQHFDSSYEEGDQCITSDFGSISETQMSFTMSWYDENGEGNVTGTATLTGAAPGQFLFDFPGVVPDFFNVIGVDYDRYSCAYACRQIGGTMNEYAWIHFRTNDRNETLLAEALAEYTKYGIDVTKFDVTLQGVTCPYASVPQQ